MRSVLPWALVLLTALTTPVSAASLQVSPVLFDLPPTANATQLTLKNLGTDPINVQIRVFRWDQVAGEDQLTPTTDVVGSPPAASLQPGEEHIVRLVRVAGGPVEAEESYRVVIDELPQPRTGTQSSVNFVMRYSIPIFYSAGDDASDLVWQASIDDAQLLLRASNPGGRHIRLSELAVSDASGASIAVAPNLAGYVLPDSEMQWATPLPADTALSAGATITISARANDGEIRAETPLETVAP